MTSRRPIPLPAGAGGIGGGLVVLGLCSYAFLALAGRALPPERFATLSVLYALVYTVGPGLFAPLEQEVGRALAERRAHGQGGRPVVARAAALGLVVVGVLFVVALALSPVLVRRLFAGSELVLAGLLLSTAGLWAAHLTRGALAGTRRFGAYGTQLALEGLLRVVGTGVLFALSVDTVGPYALLVGGALVGSVLLTVPRPRRLAEPGPPASWAELSGSLGWLLAASLLSQVLVNAGPVAVRLLAGSAQSAAAGPLLAGLVLARLPLFLFAAVEASLLPGMAALLAAGRTREFVAGLGRLLAVVVVLMTVATVAAALLGEPASRLLFGARLSLPGGTLARITAGSGAYMAAVVVMSGLVATRSYARAVLGWLAGLAVFCLVTAVRPGLVDRVVDGYLYGAAAAALALGVLLATGLRADRPVPA